MTGKKVVWTIIASRRSRVMGSLLFAACAPVDVINERQSVPIEGAVIQRDADTKKQVPIADVVITASDGVRSAATRSEASGYFKLVLHKKVLSGQPITVTSVIRVRALDLIVQTGKIADPGHSSMLPR